MTTPNTISVTLTFMDNVDNRNLVNQLLRGNLPSSGVAPASTATEKAETTAPAKTTSAKAKTETKSNIVSLDDFKNAARQVKKDHGEEFALEILEEAGVDIESTLARSIKNVDAALYAVIMEAWQEGPTAAASDEPVDDDDLGDEEDLDDEEELEVTPDSVKLAVKAYAKENGNAEAKAIMKEHGCESLATIGKLSKAKLTALAEALV